MAILFDRLNEPQTFEDMTVVVSNVDILEESKNLLISKNSNISTRVFLSAWLISRFPETIENSPDPSLKATADAVITCCLNNHNFVPVLNLFKSRFESWKEQDLSKLKSELINTYKLLQHQQIENPESANILENTKQAILFQARKIDGEIFVNEILNSSNLENLHK